jgi:hypothetical protein
LIFGGEEEAEEEVDDEDGRRVSWKIAMLSEARAFEVRMYARKVRSSAVRRLVRMLCFLRVFE